MLRLTPDQEEFLAAARVELRTHRSVLGQAATGFGKTVVGTVMAGNAVAKGLRVGWLNHKDFLIDQTSGAFDRHGIFHSFVAAGRRYNPYANVWIGSIGTVVNRLDLVQEPDLLIVDEAHHGPAKTWRRIMHTWKRCKTVGLSATPWRLSGEGLDDLFDAMVCGPSVAWLIENGRLSDYRAFAPSQPDLAGVHSRGGDYVAEEIAELMDRKAIIGDMIRHYMKHAHGRLAIYFGVSIAHSQHMAALFNAAGIPALHIDGSASTAARAMAASRFARREILVLCNVDLFGEGYDLANQSGEDVTVECVGLGRPTQSLGMHLQQIGRALRPKADPAVILDHAGNLLRHGLPDQDREWTLKPREKVKKKGDTTAPVRQCPECFGVHAIHLKACPYCGHVYQVIGRRNEEVDRDLEEIDAAKLRRSRKMEEWACKDIDELTALGRRRGYQKPEGWAAHLFTYRQSVRDRERKSREQMKLW